MRCIITGFDPFGGLANNPTQDLVLALPDRVEMDSSGEMVTLTRRVLPTCCHASWETLADALPGDSAEPCLIILTGLAQTRARISLERFALNVRDYPLADNAGHQWLDQAIDPEGPEALRTSLPLHSMLESLTASGFFCDISNHAGTFVCNDIYYRVLRHLQKIRSPGAALFMHFPLPENYGRQCFANSDDQEEESPDGTVVTRALESFRSAVVATVRLGYEWTRAVLGEQAETRPTPPG